MNGSSPLGYCSSVINFGESSAGELCTQPAGTVLFDGNVPTLTALDGDMWASQLLTIRTQSNVGLLMYFPTKPVRIQVQRVEMVIFNCPEWGISAENILLVPLSLNDLSSIFTTDVTSRNITPTITSCDSLVRVCTEMANTQLELVTISIISSNYSWLHLSEIAVYTDNSSCPPEAIVDTIRPIVDATTTDSDSSTRPTSETCPSTSKPAVLASVITAVVVTLLAIVIFVIVQISVCKHRSKLASGGKLNGITEGHQYGNKDGGVV